MTVKYSRLQYSLTTWLLFTLLAALIAAHLTMSVSGRPIALIIAGAAGIGFLFGVCKSIDRAVQFSLLAVALTWACLVTGLILTKLGM